MNEVTAIAEVLTGDCLEVSFPRHYPVKSFTTDAGKLRDILRTQTREKLTAADLAEIAELRKKLRRIDADVVMMEVIRSKLRGGYTWF